MLALLAESALRSLALGGAVWLGLTLLRVRNPHAHMTAWTLVLIASLSMPALMHRLTVTIPFGPPLAEVVETIWPFSHPPSEVIHSPGGQMRVPVQAPVQTPLEAPVGQMQAAAALPATMEPGIASPQEPVRRTVDWRALITGIYILVAGVLLLRLLIGVMLTWRMARAARPLDEIWAAGADVRVSDVVGVPVTFGSTVLLPREYIEWGPAKRRAVLLHERSHVVHGDFYVLLLAALNRAVFWFNPFAWWQLARLAELAEIISDDAAIEILDDRPCYADILLNLAGNVQRAPAGLAMARACTVRRRVERILEGTTVFAEIGWRQRILIAAGLAPVVAISASTIAFGTPKPSVTLSADPVPVAVPMTVEQKRVAIDANLFDRYAGHYIADPKVLPDLVLTVTREGGHLFVQRTGQAKLEVFPESDHAFFYGVIDQQITFLPDSEGRAGAMILHQNGMDIEARRADLAAAKHAAELFDRRFADQARPRTAIDVDPNVFERYVGYYQLNPRSIFTITREGDRLFAQLTGQPKRRLFAASESEYFYKLVTAQITFVGDAGEQATGLVLHQNGREFPSIRVDETQARAAEARAQEQTKRRAEQERPRTAVAVDPNLYDRHAGLYQRGPNSIFTVTREHDRLFVQLTGRQKLEVFPESDREFFYRAAPAQVTFVADSAGRPTELIVHQDGTDLRATRIADVPHNARRNGNINASILDLRAGWYELGGGRALAVTRAADRLVVQETGRPKFELLAYSDREFVSNDGNSFIIFMTDAQGGASELLLQQPSPGARRATRIDAARAQALENAFTRRVAAAPDRFKDQTPAQGGKDAVLRMIDELQRGAPSYDRMSARLADNVRRQVFQLHGMLRALGAVDSVFFRGVGPGGYDIYGAKFANGFAEFRLLVGPDGETEDMVFRPDGDDTPGGVVDCSQEQSLKSQRRTAPIKLLLYNGSGADIQAVWLDLEGKRARYVTIGDDRSAPILTYTGRPWVITDASGRCLQIVLAGHRTRYLAVQSPEMGEQPDRTSPRRATPMPGSEEALRQYIDALARGEPNYDRMTPQTAAETREQLLLNQAILAKLGSLRAMSFRGVSPLGSDVYIVHFANGSAEWRIGLVKEGRIGRIALGPQY